MEYEDMSLVCAKYTYKVRKRIEHDLNLDDKHTKVTYNFSFNGYEAIDKVYIKIIDGNKTLKFETDSISLSDRFDDLIALLKEILAQKNIIDEEELKRFYYKISLNYSSFLNIKSFDCKIEK